MTQINTLLELRNKIKKKKPDFVRHDFHKKRLKKKWRKPRGIHSKINKKGKPKGISIGYSSPKAVRCLHKKGLKPILVKSLTDIAKIKKETEGAIIGKGTGLRKRQELLKKLKEMKVEVLNIKDADAYLKKIENNLNARREKKKLKVGQEKKKEEKPKKEEKLAEKITVEEKKKEEKKEKDKILTKKL